MKAFKKITFAAALFALMFTFAFNTSYAQIMDTTKTQTKTSYTLKGKVVDAQSMTVVSNAEISVSGTDVKTTTDEDGKFKLTTLPAGSNTVKIKADNYQTWKKKLTLDEDLNNLTVKLKPKE